jgi:hypothetical protein
MTADKFISGDHGRFQGRGSGSRDWLTVRG